MSRPRKPCSTRRWKGRRGHHQTIGDVTDDPKRVARVLSGQTTKSTIKGLGQISGVTVQSSNGLVTYEAIPDNTRKTTCFTGLKTQLKTCGQRIGRLFDKHDDGVE